MNLEIDAALNEVLTQTAHWKNSTKEVLKGFGTADEAKNWVQYLYWTNLYKISLKSTGNPHGSLQKAIGEACQKMLVTEIEGQKPKRILFLTGQWWAQSFLNGPNFISQQLPGYTHVFQTGFWDLGNNSRASVVVADHPERKKRSIIISEISDAFNQLLS